MAESKSTVVVPLNSSNYPTWKVQCRMALMKDGLWNIVNGTERPPLSSEAEQHAKFMARRDRALAIIVLSVEPSLLYLIGDPEDPIVVWKKLADQFQKKTWANKLELRRKLYSLRLKEGNSVQEHIKEMTETFEGLSVIGDKVEDEDRVVYLLASLPDSYNMLVTALEANTDVPAMEVVTERLLHEESKMKERIDVGTSSEKAMAARPPRCHYCGRIGHIKRYCREFARAEQRAEQKANLSRRNLKQVKKAGVKQRDATSSESESDALVVSHALSASTKDSWIVVSGATCHMCSNEKLFVELHKLKQPFEVTLGDGYALKATGQGIVALEMKLPQGKTRMRKLHNVLYVPNLSYNLVSVSRAAEAGKTTTFDETCCQIQDRDGKLVAMASRAGSLYYLDCQSDHQQVHVATKEDVWHRRFGHLGARSLQKLARDELVEGLDYDPKKEISFCESCTEGKHSRSPFPTCGGKRSEEPLGLVHSDVCGKMNAQSLSGAEYFLTFIDDKTRFVWVYVLKRKDQVFERSLEWKPLAEKSTGRKLKILRTDNGGEYISSEFKQYLKSEGVRHELTVPKTPEQNGVAERMNRTLVEMVRSMLADAKLPHRFWAEALSTAAYLRNRSPTKAVSGMTPFEAWTGETPNVKYLRTFGCVAYAHIPKDERHKLDPKARKCVLLGYGTETKGYRLYDPDRARVFHSRDVVFDEARMGIEKEPDREEQKERYIEIEHLSEEEAVADGEVEPVLRRSTRERRPPNPYGEWATVADGELTNPTLEEALESPD